MACGNQPRAVFLALYFFFAVFSVSLPLYELSFTAGKAYNWYIEISCLWTVILECEVMVQNVQLWDLSLFGC